jgi:HSP90 family molecular chaperone
MKDEKKIEKIIKKKQKYIKMNIKMNGKKIEKSDTTDSKNQFTSNVNNNSTFKSYKGGEILPGGWKSRKRWCAWA